MTGKKQQNEQEELRAARPIMIRALTVLAAIAALAVSAAPVASAFERSNAPFTVDMAKKPPPGLLVGGSGGAGSLGRTSKADPSKARVGGKMHLEDISLGVKASPKKRGSS